jgi:Bestrophin, RFP-TM, chloride channel
MKASCYDQSYRLLAIAAALSSQDSLVSGFSPSVTSSRSIGNHPSTFVVSSGKRQRSTFSQHRTPTSVASSSCTIHSDDPMNNRHSASDWLYNIRSFPQSKVLREIRNPVLAVAGWSFVVSLVYRIGMTPWATPSLRYLSQHMCIPGTAHSFLVSALGLLLVFRTNSAYQRFNVRTISTKIPFVDSN